MDEVLSALSSLTAAEYEYGTPTDSTLGFGDPSLIVTLNFAGGTTRTLVIGNQKTGQSKFWVKVPERQYIYLINDFDQKKFDKKPEDFEKQALKGISKAGILAPVRRKLNLRNRS